MDSISSIFLIGAIFIIIIIWFFYKRLKLKLEPRDTIALAALGVAIFSIILGANNAYQSDRMVHTNIKPILETYIYDFEDKKSVSLINYGLGPAVITETKFYKNGNESREIEDLFDWPYDGHFNFSSFGPLPTYVGKDEKMILAEMTSKRVKQKNYSNRRKIMEVWTNNINGTQITIAYEDILGEKQEPLSKEISITGDIE
jgi:hypothetical protein